MQEENISGEDEYWKYIQTIVECLKNGVYGEAVLKIENLRKLYGDFNWKEDFAIMFSENSNDFWENLCIFNLCSAGTEACCDSGCCVGCCGMVCVATCFGLCCRIEPGMCLANMVIKPIECCCACSQTDCCCE